MKFEITAKRLRESLNDNGFIPQDLADRSGVAKASISQYLSGSHAPSNISSGKMAKILNVNPVWLMGFDVPKNLSTDNIVIETSPFETLMDSIGYTIVRDDPEHSGFIKYKGDMIALNYGDLDDLKQSILIEIDEKVDALATKRRLAMYAKQLEVLNAAHQIKDAIKEDLQHDNDIMDGRDF